MPYSQLVRIMSFGGVLVQKYIKFFKNSDILRILVFDKTNLKITESFEGKLNIQNYKQLLIAHTVD